MKIAFLGDIALIGKYDICHNGEDSVKKRLSKVKTVLEDCDYVIANLESPLTDISKTREHKSMPLRSGSANIKVLKYLGIDAVSLANNHIYDYGKKGLDETIRILGQNNIDYFGIGKEPLSINSKGENISVQGFCCFTANGWHYDTLFNKGELHAFTPENIERYIDQAKKRQSYPIIIPHWGEENTHYPKSEHVFIAKNILEKTNCSIVGHHPHVSQGIIYGQKGLCAFSLGNFIFDDCYSPKNGMKVIQTEANRKGFVLILEFQNNKLIDNEVIPYHDKNEGIVIDWDGISAIKEYSRKIESLYGKAEYEQLRQEEQNKARVKRLGKRDLRWLANHFNFSSFMTVVQRKINEKQFAIAMSKVDVFFNNISAKRKILYVGNFGLPNSNAAGKRVYANSLLLSKCGFDVLMIGTEPLTEGKEFQITNRISYMSFPDYGKKTGIKYFRWLKLTIEKTKGKPKMIVRYGSPGLALFDWYLYKYASKENIIIVTDVVDWLQVDSTKPFFRLLKGIDTFLEKAIFNKFGDGLIAISSYLYNYYDKSYKYKIIIPPLVGHYEKKSVQNKIPQIVYAGIPFRKGQQVRDTRVIKDRLDVIVKSFCALAAKGIVYNLHIIGISKEEYLIAFPEHKGLLEGVKEIKFHGKLTMQKTHQMILEMDYSILLREKSRATKAGFPTKIVESMSLGVPVITTNTGDLAKYISSGVNGYIVDMEDLEKLNAQIMTIISTDNELIDQMKQRIVDEKMFLVDNYEEQVKKFVDTLLLKNKKCE